MNTIASTLALISGVLCAAGLPAQAADCKDLDFDIYFETNSSTLTTNAYGVIEHYANELSACDYTGIQVYGHTDTREAAAGDAAALKLSFDRAANVAIALIENGVSRGQINTGALTVYMLAKQTGPGVGEPLNRRAEIRVRAKN